MRTGLVLEGGAMRGIYTAGVLDVFMELGINFDGVLGVSAGAIHGASYVSGQHGRNLRYMKKYCTDWRFMSMRSFILTGSLVGTKFSYEELPYHLDPFDFDTFINSKTKFYACVTNLETGEAEYMRGQDREKCLDIIRASSSMPLVSKIVEIDGKKYLDGGTSDSIPIEAFRNMGFEKNVVVLTRPLGYQKQPEKAMSFIKRKYAKFPKYIEKSAERYSIYNETLKKLEQLETDGDTLVIRPSRTVNIGRTEKNPEVIQKQYNLGREDTLKMKDKIMEFLNQNTAEQSI